MLMMDFIQMTYFTQIRLYVENKHWNQFDNAGLVRKNLLQGENDYGNEEFFYGLFLAPKVKRCLTIDKYGVIDQHRTFNGFTNVSDILDRQEFFKMYDGHKLITKVPSSWKKSSSMGVVNPHKITYCNTYSKDVLCDDCDKIVNQNKELSANLNELKNKIPMKRVICFL